MKKRDLHTVFLARLMMICDDESIKYDEKVLVELIMKFFPDFRRCINEVQRYIVSVIDSGLFRHYQKRNLHL